MKKILTVTALVVLIAGFFWVKYFTMLLDSKNSAIIVNKPYSFAENYEDQKTLADAVDNIFIGEVIREVGDERYDGQVNTQFLIRITQNIKGALLGEVTVNQQGGYYKENGKLYFLSYEKTPLLKQGEMYFFAVRNSGKGYFEMMPKYGDRLLDSEDEKFKLMKDFKSILAEN